jgi:sporulation protein YlmC with PRC-barrel domain
MKLGMIAAIAAALLAAPAVAVAQAPAEGTFVTVQPPGQWLASLFIGEPVTNHAGENIGDINDLLFDKSGTISTVVIGVGGFLGIGEKDVAVPFNSLSVTADANGKRVVTASLSKERLMSAPEFKATEKTVYMRAREQATELGRKAVDKANELTDKAAKKFDEMRSSDPKPAEPRAK